MFSAGDLLALTPASACDAGATRATAPSPAGASASMRPRAGAPPPATRRAGSDIISKPTAANDNQNPGCSNAQGSSSVTGTIAASATSEAGQFRPALRNAAVATSITTVRCAGTPHPASNAYSQATPTPPQRAATGVGSHSAARSERRHDAPMAAPPSQPSIVMWSPEIDMRCATPVSRNTSQPGPAIAAWSPTASAASAPVAAASSPPSRTLSIRRSRTHWRAFSIGAQPLCSSTPLPRTVPVARRPWSNNHSSASKPSGFIAPCGRRRRTGSRQRWPACSGAGDGATARSSRWLRLQASQTREGTTGAPAPGGGAATLAGSASSSAPVAGGAARARSAAASASATAESRGRPAAASSDCTRFSSRPVMPATRADSTTNAKCRPSSATWGISSTTPVSSTSQPSHASASASASRTSARQPA